MTNFSNKKPNGNPEGFHYRSTMSRRDSIRWLGVLAAGAAVPKMVVAQDVDLGEKAIKGHWPEDLKIPVIKAPGYGKDPSMMSPSVWPKTLTAAQLDLVAVLSDILVPREGDVPSASEVKVPDVVDEWVSAPYKQQQADRLTILSALRWIDDESVLRFKKSFVKLSDGQQFEIMDDIAYTKKDLPQQFHKIAHAFNRLRQLVVAAFFCSPEGTKDLGYVGNVAIAGDYPGPTDEAMKHLHKVLGKLGLSL